MSLHQEHHFEAEICQHLAAHGWLHEPGDAALFDRANGLFLPDLLAYERGTLEVLRRGVEMLGLKGPLMLAQFKPALAINPTTQAHYAANRLRVVRQVCHSPNNPKEELDLVLFVNGIPVATAELKSDFTQSVHDAVDQYRFDRHPAPKGGVLEPLLGFPGGALVHFAVSKSEVMMTTRLAGPATTFLPFNQGDARWRGQPRPTRMAPHRLPVGRGLGARELAGDPRPLPASASATTRSSVRRSSSRATTSSTRPASCRPPCCARGRAAST
jgi:type I restriction enzyme R subunit